LTHIGLTGESGGTARRLAAVEKMVADNQCSEAVEEYIHILNEVGDDLVPVDPRHSLQARRLCFQGLIRLAAPNPASLRQYQKRVDPATKKWWEQAAAAHDVRLLRQIVQEAFCSSVADRALDMLGDLAFERGDFDEADHWWRMLTGPRVERGRERASSNRIPAGELVFPTPQVDLARVCAKRIIVQMVHGNRDELTAAINAYKVRYGQVEGELAGQKARYIDTLKQLVSEVDHAMAAAADRRWTTFAGDASRQWRGGKGPSPYMFAARSLQIGPVSLLDRKLFNQSRTTAGTFPFFPVIAGGLVLVADATHVIGYDWRTGQLAGFYDLFKDLNQRPSASWDISLQPGARYTVTVAEHRIFVRLGNQLSESREDSRDRYDSFMVCLNLQPADDGRLQRQWLVRCKEPKTLFEGSPVVNDGRAYITRVHFDGAQVTTAVECYNASSGSRQWRQPISEIRELTDGDRSARHHLLTLAGPNIVYCSHSGAVVGLDALTGRRCWGVRYPSRGSRTANGDPTPRDLAPCVYAAGKLFVAPADYDRIFCLDADSGATLWESQPLEVVQLIGVAGQKLIVTTHSKPAGIRALDTLTGKSLREWMQPAVADNALPTQGRGFLAGGKVFWPTQEGLLVLDQEDGQPDPADGYYFSKRFGNRLGNLAFGGRCLAIATATELRVFVPTEFRPGSSPREVLFGVHGRRLPTLALPLMQERR
jgi:outer membrane protein assembly factor BamB